MAAGIFRQAWVPFGHVLLLSLQVIGPCRLFSMSLLTVGSMIVALVRDETD